MSDDNPSSDDQSSSLSEGDKWFIQLGVSRDSFNQADAGATDGDNNGLQVAGVGPGNWGRGPGQDYRGPGGANEPGPDNPVKVPGDGDNAPDTVPQNRINIDPDADPEAPTDPSPTLRSPEYDPTPKGPPDPPPVRPPSTPPDPPPANPSTPPPDDIPPTLRSPVNNGPSATDLGGPGAASVVITGDVVLTGSIVAVGVVEIAGAIYKIVIAWQISDLAQSYTPSVNAAQAGFKAAMTSGPAPGDQFGKLGYDQGSRNFQALFAKAKQDNPQATDDAIKAAIAAKADEALNQVSSAIDQAVRGGMWDGYLAAHSTALSGDDARWAYVACFGDEPNSKNPDAHWKKYMDAHPYLAWTSPK
jgi:hypothetical protein